MSTTLFSPTNVGDIEKRLTELDERTNNVVGYSDGVRGEVLNLIEWAERIVRFDSRSKRQVEEALRDLEAGNARLALARLSVAMQMASGG